ncbi:MAG: hypothetical protein II578_02150 [Bacteroidaceae bacterium]|nr:hypothetical protein [Bacteroidaceae bacterium]
MQRYAFFCISAASVPKKNAKKQKRRGAMPNNALHFVGYDTWFFGLPQAGNKFLHAVFALLAGGSLAAA